MILRLEDTGSVVTFGYGPLEERVLAFAARQCGIAVGQVDLMSRLVEDLGLDGTHAQEFFVAFGREFEVNLGALRGERWKRHFRPPDLSTGPAPAAVFLMLTLFLSASILAGFLSWAWLWLLVFVAIWLFGSRAWPLSLLWPDTIPITVQDLVDAAVAGRWVKPLHP
jgi:hypothetical protein